MYYFAYIDADNICTNVYAMPSDLSTVPGYITITEEQYNSQEVIGKRWNAELLAWEDVIVYYYAVLDADGVCLAVIESETEVVNAQHIEITSLDQSYVGKWFDVSTATWYDEVPFHVLAAHSTDEINVGNSDVSLTTKLTELENAGGGSGSGTPGEDGEDGGYYAPSVDANGNLTWTPSKEGMPAVTGVNIKGAAGLDAPTLVIGTVTTGEPGTPASVQGVLDSGTNTMTLNFTIPKGADGTATEVEPFASNKIVITDGEGSLTTSDVAVTVLTYLSGLTGNVQQQIDGCAIVGEVKWLAGNTAPDGYLLCNGAAVSRTTYAKLFAAIGTAWGAGNGSSTFNLPNLMDKTVWGGTAAGSYKTAGLPNVIGELSNFVGTSAPTVSGALSIPASGSSKFTNDSAGNFKVHRLSLKASDSNAIYGSSTTVQPPAAVLRPFIKC